MMGRLSVVLLACCLVLCGTEYTDVEMALLQPILMSGMDGEVPEQRSFYTCYK